MGPSTDAFREEFPRRKASFATADAVLCADVAGEGVRRQLRKPIEKVGRAMEGVLRP